jgi:hypothetical protein
MFLTYFAITYHSAAIEGSTKNFKNKKYPPFLAIFLFIAKKGVYLQC